MDICHGVGALVDQRFYFADLESAFDFYLEGSHRAQHAASAGGSLRGLIRLGTADAGRSGNTWMTSARK